MGSDGCRKSQPSHLIQSRLQVPWARNRRRLCPEDSRAHPKDNAPKGLFCLFRFVFQVLFTLDFTESLSRQLLINRKRGKISGSLFFKGLPTNALNPIHPP